MKRKSIKSLIVIGVMAGITGCISFFIHKALSPTDDKFFHPPYFSPDHRYKAVLINHAGQVGLIAGYFCFDNLSVVASSVKEEEADEKRFRVYSGDCHSFADPVTNARKNGPEIKWVSNNELHVTYSNRMNDSDVTTSDYAEQGHIHITYGTR